MLYKRPPPTRKGNKKRVREYIMKYEYQKNHKRTEYDDQTDKFLIDNKGDIEVIFSHKGKYFPEDKEERDIYRVILKREGKTPYEFTFGQSLANSSAKSKEWGRPDKPRILPTPYDVLACLTKHDVGDFCVFANDFGYDLNKLKEYRKAQKTHLAVQEEYENVMRLFSDVIDQLQEIQ